MYEATTYLSRLVERMLRGEEIVIARAGMPVARLVPWTPESTRRRVLGRDAGHVVIATDFDAPLPADTRSGFEG